MRAIGILLGVLLLSACTNRSYTPVVPEALAIGAPLTVFAATTRAKKPDGSFGFERSEILRRLELTVSIPPSHTPGELQYAYAKPNPRKQFTMAARDEFATSAAFRTRVGQVMDGLKGQDREVTVFIHGYNATQAETAFRAAQLASDIKLPGALVIYSWPSRGKSVGYAYDIDSALFARDGLEQLLFELKAAGANRILLVAHSMGSLLMMETLRQIDLHEPGWVGNNIGGVLLISPDLDIELFRRQMKSLSRVPQPFVVFVSGRDRLLNLSARLRGNADRERLGNISSIERIADLPIEIIDTTAFSKGAGSAHFVPASSPAFISMINDMQSLHDTFGPDPRGFEFLLPAGLIRQNSNARLTHLSNTEIDR